MKLVSVLTHMDAINELQSNLHVYMTAYHKQPLIQKKFS